MAWLEYLLFETQDVLNVFKGIINPRGVRKIKQAKPRFMRGLQFLTVVVMSDMHRRRGERRKEAGLSNHYDKTEDNAQ